MCEILQDAVVASEHFNLIRCDNVAKFNLWNFIRCVVNLISMSGTLSDVAVQSVQIDQSSCGSSC